MRLTGGQVGWLEERFEQFPLTLLLFFFLKNAKNSKVWIENRNIFQKQCEEWKERKQVEAWEKEEKNKEERKTKMGTKRKKIVKKGRRIKEIEDIYEIRIK